MKNARIAVGRRRRRPGRTMISVQTRDRYVLENKATVAAAAGIAEADADSNFDADHDVAIGWLALVLTVALAVAGWLLSCRCCLVVSCNWRLWVDVGSCSCLCSCSCSCSCRCRC